MTERFIDREANDHAGAEVTARVVQSIQYRTERSTQCLARGVMATEDGKVYTFTVRREGHGDPGYGNARRIATLMNGTFADTARGLLEFERPYIDPDLITGPGGYQEQVDAL